jgi:aryl-alcohol dehydrogenase-like predicted oxidoreductase
MHHVWREADWDKIWQAFELLVRQGKVLYVGSSNFGGWNIAQACERARARNALGLVSEQSLYNLTTRTVELEVLPACRAYGLGVLPWSPLAGGILGGTQEPGARRSRPEARQKVAAHRARADAWERLCRELGEHPASVALAWLLANEVVTAPILGPRTVAQLDAAMRALHVRLDPAAMQQLDQLFPGPGGPAPEAYAW